MIKRANGKVMLRDWKGSRNLIDSLILLSREKMRVIDLTRRMNNMYAWTSKVVDEMESKGLVKRRKIGRDCWLIVSEKGMEAGTKLAEVERLLK